MASRVFTKSLLLPEYTQRNVPVILLAVFPETEYEATDTDKIDSAAPGKVVEAIQQSVLCLS